MRSRNKPVVLAAVLAVSLIVVGVYVFVSMHHRLTARQAACNRYNRQQHSHTEELSYDEALCQGVVQ